MCTLLAQCASPRIGCWHSRGYAYTASRAWAVRRDHAPSQDSAGASLLDWQTWWSRVTNVGPVRHRAIDSSELRLTTDREGRQVGQHRSHIVAAVSSAWLIARAAASGSRRVGSCQASRPAGRVQTSACLLSGVICRRHGGQYDRSGRRILMVGGSICMYSSRSLQICPLINRDHSGSRC